ncbi:MAG TPA: Crp/Fnr family transcriptional regulator [Vicinamibacterales bacterium]|jgi:CRP/FNR family cyclic AMP-dependent transcriptional regulator|nr:Crp/Fnr family transcriptional regulator [Vicinamibacterales bacterium]
MPRASRKPRARFNPQTYLDAVGGAARSYPSGATIYSQGDLADRVFYLRSGHVKLAVVSSRGKEAIVGMLGPGEFFGEGCLAGQRQRIGMAIARDRVSVTVIPRRTMQRLLREQHEMSDLFISKILTRNIRVEEDLVDLLFNSSEKRLARALLRLAVYQGADAPPMVVPAISQETLAEIVGTTRSRVNVFLQRFRQLGFIEGRTTLRVNASLLSVVLADPM